MLCDLNNFLHDSGYIQQNVLNSEILTVRLKGLKAVKTFIQDYVHEQRHCSVNIDERSKSDVKPLLPGHKKTHRAVI